MLSSEYRILCSDELTITLIAQNDLLSVNTYGRHFENRFYPRGVIPKIEEERGFRKTTQTKPNNWPAKKGEGRAVVGRQVRDSVQGLQTLWSYFCGV